MPPTSRGSSSAGPSILKYLRRSSPHAYEPINTMDPIQSSISPTSKGDVEAVEHVSVDRPAHRDRAGQLLNSSHEQVKITAAENKRILRKIDLTILPILLFVYFLQALDKATLAYASVFGLLTDANLKGEEYSWLGSIVYIAQLVMQPLVAYFLVKLPIGKFTGTVVLGWGVVLCGMAAAHNFKGLLATRFLLGAFEASVAPAFVAITQMWWRRYEQTNRTSAWYAMNGCTNMFGSLLAYGLGHINSKLHSYQVIFLFCGCITVAFSFVIYIFLPDSPVDAKFLNEHDKIVAVERLRMNQMGVMSREWKWTHLKESFFDLKTWFWFSLLFSISIPSGGISTFGPLIIKSFGFNKFQTILFNIPFGAVQIVATMGGAFLATYLKRKGPVIALLCVFPIIGCVMLLSIKHTADHRAALLTGYYLISVYPGITPLIYSWSAQNTAGDTKRKCTTGFLFIGQSAGNIIGPHLYTTAEAPEYHRGLVSNLALYIIIVVLVCLTTLYLNWLNRRHAERRVALGKEAVINDTSMNGVMDADEDSVDGDGYGEDGVAPGVKSGVGERKVGDKAFDDETDLMNEDFVFVY